MLIKTTVISLFQIAAFIAAVWTWKQYKNSTQKNFIYYLGYVLVTEFISIILVYDYHISSQSIYNIFIIVTFLFYLHWFYTILEKKRWVIIAGIIFLISVLLSIFYEPFFTQLWRISLTAGTVLILICSGIFYFELLKKEEIFNYLQSQKFWIVTSLLIFYIGFLPLNLLMPYIDTRAIPFTIAITSLNIILYGLITYSFKWVKNN